MIEALQNYAQLASGLTKTTREKAVATAKGLLAQAGLSEVAADAQERVSKLADDIVETSKANRKLLVNFVAAEVDKAVVRLGLARAEDLEALRAEIASLRSATEAARSAAPRPAATTSAAPPAAAPPTAKRAPSKKAAASAPAKSAPAKKAPAETTTAAKVPTKKTPAKKAAVKKTSEGDAAVTGTGTPS